MARYNNMLLLLVLFSLSANAWLTDSCINRQLINATTAQAVTNHTLRIHMNGTDVTANFDWATDNETMTFADENDNELDCWHETFNDTQENFTVWCRRDTTAGNTLLYLYYNCTGTDYNSNITKVWGSSLVAFYTLDQAGTTAFDFGGSTANDATISNAAGIQTSEAVYGSALDSRSGYYGQAVDDNELDLTEDMSIVAWLYWDDSAGSGTQEGAPVMKGEEDGGWDANYAINWGEASHAHDYEPTFLWDQSGAKDHWGDTQAPYQAWFHFAAIHSDTGNTVDFYYNGSLVTNDVAASEAMGADAHPLTLGCGYHAGAATTCWDGYLDNIMIYSKALSGTDVASMYISEPPTFTYGAEETWTHSHVTLHQNQSVEGRSEKFELNVTIDPALVTNILNVTFTYNGTVYGPTTNLTTSANSYHSINITMPSIVGATNDTHNHYWDYVVNLSAASAEYENSTVGTMTNYKIKITNCSAASNSTNVTRRFFVANESNAALIASDYNLYLTVTFPKEVNFQYNFSDMTNITVCIFPTFTNYTGNFAISYRPNGTYVGYTNRSYTLNSAYMNITPQNVTMYTTLGTTTIKITVVDQVSDPLEDVRVDIYEYIHGVGEGNLIEVGLTNAEGITAVELAANSYANMYFYVDGILRLTQQEIYLDQTSYTFTVVLTEVGSFVEVLNGVSYSCVDNSSQVACTITDSTGLLQNWNLTVSEKRLNNASVLNCTQGSTINQTLTCVIGDTSNLMFAWTLFGVFNATDVLFTDGWIGGTSTATYSTIGLIFAFFVVIGTIAMFYSQPEVCSFAIAGDFIVFWLMNLVPMTFEELTAIVFGVVVFVYILMRVKK